MPDGQVLEFSRVTKTFGTVTAVSDLSAQIEPGAVTGFLGPNGAGKTTSLRILLGQIKPTSGTATIGGVAYAELRHPLRTVGAVLEDTTYRPRRTALRQLTMAAKANGIALSRVDEVLSLVGLGDDAETRIGTYSLGMRQRLSVATALLGDPGALVLDEPANGLDPAGIRWMRLLMRRLADEGRTVLASSHVLSEIEQVADNVLVISKGRLVYADGIENLADPNQGTVVVDAEDRSGLVVALRNAGLEYELLRSGVTVRSGDAAAVGAVAAAAGIALTALQQRGPTLEDVFLHLVSGGQLEPRAEIVGSPLPAVFETTHDEPASAEEPVEAPAEVEEPEVEEPAAEEIDVVDVEAVEAEATEEAEPAEFVSVEAGEEAEAVAVEAEVDATANTITANAEAPVASVSDDFGTDLSALINAAPVEAATEAAPAATDVAADIAPDVSDDAHSADAAPVLGAAFGAAVMASAQAAASANSVPVAGLTGDDADNGFALLGFTDEDDDLAEDDAIAAAELAAATAPIAIVTASTVAVGEPSFEDLIAGVPAPVTIEAPGAEEAPAKADEDDSEEVAAAASIGIALSQPIAIELDADGSVSTDTTDIAGVEIFSSLTSGFIDVVDTHLPETAETPVMDATDEAEVPVVDAAADEVETPIVEAVADDAENLVAQAATDELEATDAEATDAVADEAPTPTISAELDEANDPRAAAMSASLAAAARAFFQNDDSAAPAYTPSTSLPTFDEALAEVSASSFPSFDEAASDATDSNDEAEAEVVDEPVADEPTIDDEPLAAEASESDSSAAQRAAWAVAITGIIDTVPRAGSSVPDAEADAAYADVDITADADSEANEHVAEAGAEPAPEFNEESASESDEPVRDDAAVEDNIAVAEDTEPVVEDTVAIAVVDAAAAAAEDVVTALGEETVALEDDVTAVDGEAAVVESDAARKND